MKFTGLILMCAASSLALLLPALGVVKFPVLDNQIAAGVAPGSDPDLARSSSAPYSAASARSGTQNLGQPGQLLGQLPSYPDGNRAGNSGGQSNGLGNGDPGTTPGLLAAAQASAGNAPEGNLDGSQNPNRPKLGRLPFTEIPSQRLGLGVWLLLVPVQFLGLGMWTFGTSPKRAK
ncbi:MAG: hypothetical protein ACOYOZ_04445 [Pirellula sp.]